MPDPDTLPDDVRDKFQQLENELTRVMTSMKPEVVLDAVEALQSMNLHRQAVELSDLYPETIKNFSMRSEKKRARLLNRNVQLRTKSVEALKVR